MRRPLLTSAAAGIALAYALALAPAAAAGTVSAADRAFVAKVSQGGMFEVVASKLAQRKALAQNVKDQAATEVHDHTLVGAKLTSIAAANGMPIATQLNAMFQAKVDTLAGLSGAAFDAAYIGQMRTIHDMDGAAFAKESTGGENGALRAFAAETVLIVKRHIGALRAVGPAS